MMQFYPQREERAGEGPGGRFYLAELTGILPALLEEFAGKVQLIYIDPPFGTGDAFCLRMKQGAADWQGVSASQCLPAYEDTLPREEYLRLMRATLVGARELLSEEGAIFLHCDWHRSAHLRLLLDEVFGARNFVNEIIWAYQTGGRSRRHFSRKHDNIFFYRKSKNLFFDAEAVATARGARDNHLKRHVDADGRVYRSVRTAGKVYTYYDDEPVPPSDVWDDVSHMQQRDPRRSGYDGQKPAALLERILKCASREGDLVADLMCGSGAFLSAASALGRRFFGVDQSPRAAAAAISSTVEKPSGLASVWVWESTTSCMETPLLNDGGAPWSAAKRSARTEAAAQAPGTRRQRYPSSMSPSTSPPSYATAQARTIRRSRTSYTLYPLSRRKRTARTGAPPAGRTSHGSA